jgi:hypothetical protein
MATSVRTMKNSSRFGRLYEWSISGNNRALCRSPKDQLELFMWSYLYSQAQCEDLILGKLQTPLYALTCVGDNLIQKRDGQLYYLDWANLCVRTLPNCDDLCLQCKIRFSHLPKTFPWETLPVKYKNDMNCCDIEIQMINRSDIRVWKRSLENQQHNQHQPLSGIKIQTSCIIKKWTRWKLQALNFKSNVTIIPEKKDITTSPVIDDTTIRTSLRLNLVTVSLSLVHDWFGHTNFWVPTEKLQSKMIQDKLIKYHASKQCQYKLKRQRRDMGHVTHRNYHGWSLIL